MYLIHNRAIKRTPRALAQAFGCHRVLFPLRRAIPEALRLSRDFFCYYPDPAGCIHTDDLGDYAVIRAFAEGNKFQQRMLLSAAGLPHPETFGPGAELPAGHYVQRPLRHMKRIRFEELDLPQGATVPPGHYCSSWVEIKREYRTLFVRGEPIATFKKNPLVERRWQLTSLDRLGLLDKLREFKPLRLASMAGVDLVKTTAGLALVLEINLAPALCPKNMERVTAAFRASQTQGSR